MDAFPAGAVLEVPLTAEEVTPVTTFTHHIDSVKLTIPPGYAPDSVLVIQETALREAVEADMGTGEEAVARLNGPAAKQN